MYTIPGPCYEILLGLPHEDPRRVHREAARPGGCAVETIPRHYHADGTAELIGKQVVQILKREGAMYSWNPAETPELNATTELK